MRTWSTVISYVLPTLVGAVAISIWVGALMVAWWLGESIVIAYVKTAAWRTTNATVATSTIHNDCGSFRYGTRYSVHTRYEYVVAQQSYVGSRIQYGLALCTNRPDAEAVANRLSGSVVFVYYDPSQPTQSVLVPDFVGNGTVPLFAFSLLVSIAVPWWAVRLARIAFAQDDAGVNAEIDRHLGAKLGVERDGKNVVDA